MPGTPYTKLNTLKQRVLHFTTWSCATFESTWNPARHFHNPKLIICVCHLLPRPYRSSSDGSATVSTHCCYVTCGRHGNKSPPAPFSWMQSEGLLEPWYKKLHGSVQRGNEWPRAKYFVLGREKQTNSALSEVVQVGFIHFKNAGCKTIFELVWNRNRLLVKP